MARHGSDMSHHEEHSRVLVAHAELLEASIGEQLGPLAESLVRTLNRRGALTLKELADVVRREPFGNPLNSNNSIGGLSASSGEAMKQIRCPISIPVSAGDIATDTAIKEIMTRLVLHRVVMHDAETHTYRVALGYGLLLRTLFPRILQFFQRRYGETGVTLLMIFHQLAVVPWDAALRLAIERRPALSEALRHCARDMERLAFIESIAPSLSTIIAATATATGGGGGGGGEMNSTSSSTNTAATSSDPCRLHVGNILAEMLREAVHHRLLAQRFPAGGAVAAAVMEACAAASRGRRLEGRAAGFPPAHPRTSAALPLRLIIRDTLPLGETVVVETVSRMTRVDGDNLLSSDGTAGAGSMEGPYRFRYDAAVEAMQRDCCERLIFARHGVLGVRIIKLLLQHHNMEDRMLAEEAIATLPRTREILHAMMRDGYVRQQEVPKNGILTDRQTKNSVFLWSCSLERELLPTVRVQVAKSLRNVMARLSMERQILRNQTSSNTLTSNTINNTAAAGTITDAAGIYSNTGTRKISAEGVSEMLRCQRAVAALESSASALMEMIISKMREKVRPSKEVAPRDAILAQLETIKSSGRGKSESRNQQLQQLQTSNRGGGQQRHHNGVTLITPNTRRLPPIFAEHRYNLDGIRSVCNGLYGTLLKLDADFARTIRVSAVNQITQYPSGVNTSPLYNNNNNNNNNKNKKNRPLSRLAGTHKTAVDSKSLKAIADGNAGDEATRAEMEAVQRLEDIRRVRLAAADQGFSDEQSVGDYAEEPDVPRFVPGSSLREEVEAMDDALRKINASVAAMISIDERDGGNTWWTSAMLTREMRASAIRANYHARRVLKWNQRAGEHFLVDAVTTNEQSERCRADMLYLREQQNLLMQRIESCNKAQSDAAAEMGTLQEALREANRVKSTMQQQLVARAHERCLLPLDCEDPVRAEILLLLEHVAWPMALQNDAEYVKSWVRENPLPLDV